MQIGLKPAVVLVFLAFILLWESYGSDFSGLALKFSTPLLAFSASSALLLKMFAGAEIWKAAEKSFSAYAVFVFLQTAGLAAIGLLPAAIFSHWLVAFGLAALLLFISWTAFALAYFDVLAHEQPEVGVASCAGILIASSLAAAATLYLAGFSYSGLFQLPPRMPYG